MSNLDQITSFLLGKGLTREQVAGIAGNLKIESGYSPTAYNANENAIGIAQWQGGRRTRLQAYAAQTGGSETSLTTQLGFLWHELTGSEAGALAHLATTTTPGDAAAAFDQYYERSSGAARSARISAANTIYPSIGPSAGQPGYTWNPDTGLANTGAAAFRGAGTAYTTGTDGGVPWDPSLPPGSPGGPPITAESPYDRGTVAGQIWDAVSGPWANFAKTALFVVGGVALVVVGLAIAAKPAVSKAVQTAAELK